MRKSVTILALGLAGAVSTPSLAAPAGPPSSRLAPAESRWSGEVSAGGCASENSSTWMFAAGVGYAPIAALRGEAFLLGSGNGGFVGLRLRGALVRDPRISVAIGSFFGSYQETDWLGGYYWDQSVWLSSELSIGRRWRLFVGFDHMVYSGRCHYEHDGSGSCDGDLRWKVDLGLGWRWGG